MTSDTLDYRHGQELPSCNKWYHFQTGKKERKTHMARREKATKENVYHIKKLEKQEYLPRF